MPPKTQFDLTRIDLTRVIADREGIRRLNPQRFDMEQLTAVVHLDPQEQVIVGYKDVGHDEFWVAGHMPGYPLLPGVLQLEAAAQLCAFYTTTVGLMPGPFIGLGGLEKVRFRGPVRPGDRLVLVAKVQKAHRRMTICTVQGFVGDTMVLEADVLGTPLSRAEAG